MARSSILKNTGPTTLTKTWYVNGTATDVGTVTIGIVDAAGTVVVAALTATTNNGDGTYTYSLAIQTQVSELTVTWTDSTGQSLVDEIEVRGNHLFTEAEARAFHGAELANATTYPDGDIAEARDRIMDEFQQICGVSFVERYRRDQLPGTGGRVLFVKYPHVQSVLSATVSGTTVPVANVVATTPDGKGLWRTNGTWTRGTASNPLNVVVEYSHGLDTVPGDIKRAALILLRHLLVKDTTGGGLSDRAISLTDEVGTIRLSQPSNRFNRPYGIPSVDTALDRYSHRVPVS